MENTGKNIRSPGLSMAGYYDDDIVIRCMNFLLTRIVLSSTRVILRTNVWNLVWMPQATIPRREPSSLSKSRACNIQSYRHRHVPCVWKLHYIYPQLSEQVQGVGQSVMWEVRNVSVCAYSLYRPALPLHYFQHFYYKEKGSSTTSRSSENYHSQQISRVKRHRWNLTSVWVLQKTKLPPLQPEPPRSSTTFIPSQYPLTATPTPYHSLTPLILNHHRLHNILNTPATSSPPYSHFIVQSHLVFYSFRTSPSLQAH